MGATKDPGIRDERGVRDDRLADGQSRTQVLLGIRATGLGRATRQGVVRGTKHQPVLEAWRRERRQGGDHRLVLGPSHVVAPKQGVRGCEMELHDRLHLVRLSCGRQGGRQVRDGREVVTGVVQHDPGRGLDQARRVPGRESRHFQAVRGAIGDARERPVACAFRQWNLEAVTRIGEPYIGNERG